MSSSRWPSSHSTVSHTRSWSLEGRPSPQNGDTDEARFPTTCPPRRSLPAASRRKSRDGSGFTGGVCRQHQWRRRRRSAVPMDDGRGGRPARADEERPSGAPSRASRLTRPTFAGRRHQSSPTFRIPRRVRTPNKMNTRGDDPPQDHLCADLSLHVHPREDPLQSPSIVLRLAPPPFTRHEDGVETDQQERESPQSVSHTTSSVRTPSDGTGGSPVAGVCDGTLTPSFLDKGDNRPAHQLRPLVGQRLARFGSELLQGCLAGLAVGARAAPQRRDACHVRRPGSTEEGTAHPASSSPRRRCWRRMPIRTSTSRHPASRRPDSGLPMRHRLGSAGSVTPGARLVVAGRDQQCVACLGLPSARQSQEPYCSRATRRWSGQARPLRDEPLVSCLAFAFEARTGHRQCRRSVRERLITLCGGSQRARPQRRAPKRCPAVRGRPPQRRQRGPQRLRHPVRPRQGTSGPCRLAVSPAASRGLRSRVDATASEPSGDEQRGGP